MTPATRNVSTGSGSDQEVFRLSANTSKARSLPVLTLSALNVDLLRNPVLPQNEGVIKRDFFQEVIPA